jgi:hypothetical protein
VEEKARQAVRSSMQEVIAGSLLRLIFILEDGSSILLRKFV